jgi:hypothetical protein
MILFTDWELGNWILQLPMLALASFSVEINKSNQATIELKVQHSARHFHTT